MTSELSLLKGIEQKFSRAIDDDKGLRLNSQEITALVACGCYSAIRNEVQTLREAKCHEKKARISAESSGLANDQTESQKIGKCVGMIEKPKPSGMSALLRHI